MVPAVKVERDEVRHPREGFGGDTDVGAAVLEHGGNLGRAGLVQHQMDFRKGLLEARHHLGQRIAGLGVGGGDGELTVVLGAELGSDALDVAGVHQHPIDHMHQLLPWLGKAEQTFALADEQLEAQLVFQILDVLGDARLGGE